MNISLYKPDMQSIRLYYRSILLCLALLAVTNLLAKDEGNPDNNIDAHTGMELPMTMMSPDDQWCAISSNGSINAFVSDGLGNLYVGGTFTSIEGISTPSNVAKWDGTTWSAVGNGANSHSVNDLAIDGSGNLHAVGPFSSIGGLSIPSKVAMWNGSSWIPVGTGTTNNTILDIEFDGSDLYVAGIFSSIDGVATPSKVAKWDGSSWTGIGTGSTAGSITDIEIQGGDIYAIGGFFSIVFNFPVVINGINVSSGVAKWDGNSWSAVGTEISDFLAIDIEFDSTGKLYGSRLSYDFSAFVFNQVQVVRWDGTSWLVEGNTPNGSQISDLTFDPADNLYAVGSFPSIDGVASNNIAKYDGSSWTPLGSGTNASTSSVFASNDDIFVSGHFTTAGNKPTSNIARWKINPSTPLIPTMGQWGLMVLGLLLLCVAITSILEISKRSELT